MDTEILTFNSLPELEGSEKQVAWASTIRSAALAKLTRDFERLNENSWDADLIYNSHVNAPAFKVNWKAARATAREYAFDFASNAAAKFWIDTRFEIEGRASMFANVVADCAYTAA